MICKWCATAVTPGDKVCPKCKRELPPLTDCGGFNNITRGLVPPTPAAAQPKPTVQAHAPAARGQQPAPAAKHSVLPVLLGVVSVVLMVVVIFLLLNIQDNTSGLGGQHRKLFNQLESMEGRLDDMTDEWFDGEGEDEGGFGSSGLLPGGDDEGPGNEDEGNDPQAPQEPIEVKNILSIKVVSREVAVAELVDGAEDYTPEEPALDFKGEKKFTLTYELDDGTEVALTVEKKNPIKLVLKAEEDTACQIFNDSQWTVLEDLEGELDENTESASLIIRTTSGSGQDYILLVDIDLSAL